MAEEADILAREFEHNAYSSGVESSRVSMKVSEAVEAMKHSGEFFINLFLGDELEFPVPAFHIKCWDLLTHVGVHYIALALPRGHAKTTLAKLAVVWYFLFTDTRFVAYVSNTHTVAAAACKNIIKYMTCRNFVAIFGNLVFEVEQDQKGFYQFDLVLPHKLGQDGKPVVKRCILKAFGAGQQIRGTNIDDERPELAVCDDVEDNDNTATKELRNKLRSWFYGPFLKAMSKKNKKVLFLGNMLSANSLLYHFTANSDIWYSMRYGCLLSNGEPLWPDMWPEEDIRTDFLEYQKQGMSGRWFAEMMNIAMPEGSPICAEGDIVYLPEISPEQAKLAFITVDPAISQKTWADNTAIVCHGLSDEKWQSVEYHLGKITPEMMFQVIVEMCRKWGTRVVGIEAAGYQGSLKFLFEIMMHMQQFHFQIIELPHGNMRKTDRIAVWVSSMRKGLYGLTEGDFAITEQLLKYDPTKKENDDDLIDAHALFMPMVDNFMNEIIDAYELDTDAFQPQSDYNQTGV